MARKSEETVKETVLTQNEAAEDVEARGTEAPKAPVGPKMYHITLPLTRENQADVFVSVNGRSMKIQRGKDVVVDEAVYEILKNSERMDALALERSMAASQKAHTAHSVFG